MAGVEVGSGSAFQGWVGFRDQTFGDVPLGFSGFRIPEYITNPRLSIWSKYFLLLKRGHFEVVLSLKAGTNTPNCLPHRKRWTPIQLAAKDGCSEVVKILVGCMDKPNAPGSQNLTPIQAQWGQRN